MGEHSALTRNIKLDIFACFTVLLQWRKMPVLLSLMLLKFLIKISKLKEKRALKSNTLKMSVGIISLLIQFGFLMESFHL